MNLGDKLIELRKKANLSQEEVAFQLNVTRQTVSKWETNQSTPDFDKIVPLCNLFKISTDELLTGTKSEESVVIEDKNVVIDDKNKKRTTGLVIGILLYFVAVSWMIISVPFLLINPVAAVAVFILICGIATCIIIYSSIVYKKDKKEKQENNLYKQIEEIVSLITLIIYLAVSFLTHAWHITWILWIIYALIMAIIKLILSLRGDKIEE